ncbi:MAG: ImmA/IrrE family metallo-endopeptidase [Nitrospiraceae bacterium]
MRDRLETHAGRIDVFDSIVMRKIPLLFKPLDGLLGAFFPKPMPGILVTTKRPLSVQRFTGAHELGHFDLNHEPSLDNEEMLHRSPFSSHPDYGKQELEADAFAVEFMMPKWLFALHFRHQEWTSDHMKQPHVVYQLSLRIGASYEATCRALARHKVITSNGLNSLLEVPPRAIKQEVLRGYEPSEWWGDVWTLTERDQGTAIEGSRSDLFLLRLQEDSGAGYLWTFDQLDRSDFAIVRDEREGPPGETIGGQVTRWITAESTDRQSGDLILAERRPWLPHEEPLSILRFHYDLTGPELEGWSHAERKHFLGAA